MSHGGCGNSYRFLLSFVQVPRVTDIWSLIEFGLGNYVLVFIITLSLTLFNFSFEQPFTVHTLLHVHLQLFDCLRNIQFVPRFIPLTHGYCLLIISRTLWFSWSSWWSLIFRFRLWQWSLRSLTHQLLVIWQSSLSLSKHLINFVWCHI